VFGIPLFQQLAQILPAILRNSSACWISTFGCGIDVLFAWFQRKRNGNPATLPLGCKTGLIITRCFNMKTHFCMVAGSGVDHECGAYGLKVPELQINYNRI